MTWRSDPDRSCLAKGRDFSLPCSRLDRYLENMQNARSDAPTFASKKYNQLTDDGPGPQTMSNFSKDKTSFDAIIYGIVGTPDEP